MSGCWHWSLVESLPWFERLRRTLKEDWKAKFPIASPSIRGDSTFYYSRNPPDIDECRELIVDYESPVSNRLSMLKKNQIDHFDLEREKLLVR